MTTQTTRKPVNIAHVIALLEKLANQEPRKSGRFRLLMDAVAILKTAKPGSAALS